MANSIMSHLCFLEHQNLRINLHKGFSFLGTSSFRPLYRGFAPAGTPLGHFRSTGPYGSPLCNSYKCPIYSTTITAVDDNLHRVTAHWVVSVAIPYVRRTQYDRLSQKQLSFLLLISM